MCFTPQYVVWGGDNLLMDVGYLPLYEWTTMEVDPPAWTPQHDETGLK